MKRILVGLLFLAFPAYSNDDGLTAAMIKHGLPAKISVTVRSPEGSPIEDASVMFAFDVLNQREPNMVKSVTDENGVATGESLVNDKVIIHVSKDGFYKTCFKYNVWEAGKDGYKSGRWEPWNPMFETVLYERKKPLHLRPRLNAFHHLETSEMYGYDLFENRLVISNAAEGHADFLVCGKGNYYDRETSPLDPWVQKVTIHFPSSGDGLVRRRKNSDSDFKFDYQAPLDGYCQTTVFTISRNPAVPNEPFLGSDEYFFFRISRNNAATGEIEYYYGIIYRVLHRKDWEKGDACFSINYYINPTSNDRNTEF